jgi:membrane fusion protein (multidrug efflux system)
MKLGQPVSLSIDAYPDVDFHGHIDSIQSGTGARFSMLPAENATGNFVKVVQRVPVKILIDNSDRPLSPGMSVVAEVDVR